MAQTTAAQRGMAIVRDAARRVEDRLENLMSGLMTSKDKLANTAFVRNTLTRQNLDNMYRSDWISRKAVDIIPEDMTRRWRSWQADPEKLTKIETAERKLKVRQRVDRALKLARLYGWSMILIGDGSRDVSTPFDPDGIREGGLRFLHVMHRFEVTYDELDRDPMSPTFRMPRMFRYSNGRTGAVDIHPSRAVMFIPDPVPDIDVDQTTFGDPTLQVVYDALNQSQSTAANIASMIFEAKLDVVMMQDLANQLSTDEGTERLMKRFGVADRMKSQINMLLLGEGEVFERKQANFDGLANLLNLYMTFVAGAVDVPVTRFLNQSPGGMNSTGESDIRNYYDLIESKQENELRPAIEVLDDVLLRHALGDRPEDITYDFRSLWQMTEKEAADVAKVEAEISAIYSKNSLLDPFVLDASIKSQLKERSLYPGFKQALDDNEDEGRDDDRLDPDDPPPIPRTPPPDQPPARDPTGAPPTRT